MQFPYNVFNHYDLIEYLENYEKYKRKYPDFRETFPTFSKFLNSAKKHKKYSIIYLNAIRNESRKYHKFYDKR